MSRLIKQPITIPAKTEVALEAGTVRVKGPLGEIKRNVRPDVSLEVKDGAIVVAPKKTTRFARALSGTYAAHLKNMIEGVNKAFEKKLVVEGVGYRMEVKGKSVVLNVGFSHPVEVAIPDGIEATAEKNVLTLKSIDNEALGQFAANIRSTKKPEPYKGKGIRYEDEVIRRKQGKKTA